MKPFSEASANQLLLRVESNRGHKNQRSLEDSSTHAINEGGAGLLTNRATILLLVVPLDTCEGEI